jgi:hypothetical protein
MIVHVQHVPVVRPHDFAVGWLGEIKATALQTGRDFWERQLTRTVTVSGIELRAPRLQLYMEEHVSV